MIRNFDMIHDLHMFPDDEIVKYLQTLPKLNKDSIKHMIISYYKHFESLPKPQQELTKKIKIRNNDMSNDLDQFSDDEFVKYLQTLPKVNKNRMDSLAFAEQKGGL